MKLILLTTISTFLLTLAACSSASKKDAAGKEPKQEVKNSKVAEVKKEDKKEIKKEDSILANIKCSLKKDQRTLVINKTDKGCKVEYTKNNETKEAASSAFGTSHCESVKDKMVKNLTEAGFSCSK